MTRLDPVTTALPAGLETLRAAARAEGYRMLDVLVAEWASGINRFEGEGEVLVAAYCGEQLVGIGGLTVDPVLPGAFRMRRFYVMPAFRQAGIARSLVAAIVARRSTLGHQIVVHAAAGSAGFWEAVGFTPDQGAGHSHILSR